MFVTAGTVGTGRLRGCGVIGLFSGLIVYKRGSMHKTLRREEQVQGKNQRGNNMSEDDSHDWHRVVLLNLM